LKGFKDSNNKFHPITDYKKGVRKSRDQKAKTEGVKIRKARNSKLERQLFNEYEKLYKQQEVIRDLKHKMDKESMIRKTRGQTLSNKTKNSLGLSDQEFDDPNIEECDDCGGHGWTSTTTDDEKGEYTFEEECDRCHGTGLEP